MKFFLVYGIAIAMGLAYLNYHGYTLGTWLFPTVRKAPMRYQHK